MRKKIILAGLLATPFTITSSAFAADFDFFGNFTNDNDVLKFNINVGSDSNVTLFSSSWVDGGFDPILTVWDSGGNLLFQQDDGDLIGSQLSNGVLYDFSVWDNFFNVDLSIGDYIITLTQYNNFPNSNFLSDGFIQAGAPNFTAGFGCTNGQFCGVLNDNDNRTSDWAFHILNVDAANQVPEPSTPALMGLAGLSMAGIRRRRRSTITTL